MNGRISELLRVPRLRAATAFIAGARDAVVTRVRGEAGTVAEVSHRLVEANEVLRGTALVLLDPVPVFDARFDVLLRRAAVAGVVTVVLAPTGPLVQLSPGVDTLAARLAISLLVVSDPWEFSLQLHVAIGDGALPAARAALQAASIGLSAGSSLEETVTELERSIGYPLGLLDASGRTIRGTFALTEDDRRTLASAVVVEDVAEVETALGPLVAVPVGIGLHSRTVAYSPRTEQDVKRTCRNRHRLARGPPLSWRTVS